MYESEIEKYFKWAVETAGGITYKFVSPGVTGVADRIACMPDGSTWFVELKTKGGRLSARQKIFAEQMKLLRQKHAVLWTEQHINEWREKCLLR